MWENETIVLITSLKKRILGGEEKVRFARIAADNAIPPFIKSIFQSRVELYLVREEPMKVQPTAHFDLDPDDFQSVKSRLLEVFRDSAAFAKAEVEEILRYALVLRLEYLMKPVDTMRRVLFEDRNSINSADMEFRLEPFFKLLPYAEMLHKECHRLAHTSIEQDEYSKLMVDIMSQIVQDNPIKIVIHDFSVLTDFLSETKGEEIAHVEGQVIQEFLADRNLWGFKRAFDVECKLGKKDFNSADLEMTLKRYEELKSEFGSEIIQPPRATVSPPPKIDKKPESRVSILPDDFQLEESIGDATDDLVLDTANQAEESGWDLNDVISDEPLAANDVLNLDIPSEETVDELEEDDFTPHDSDFLDDEPVAQSPEEIVDEFSDSEGTEQKPVSEENGKPKNQMRIIRRDHPEESVQKEETVEKKEDPKVSSSTFILKEMIDGKTEKVFVKKLFDGDKDAYEKLINQLEDAESWRVAKILIDNELFKRDVDPFSREAIKLVDLVYSRYYPEEGIGGL